MLYVREHELASNHPIKLAGERKADRAPEEPKGELARYAYGYTDKKPGLAFWLIHAAMIAFIVYQGTRAS